MLSRSYTTKLLSLPTDATTSPVGCTATALIGPACAAMTPASFALSNTLTTPPFPALATSTAFSPAHAPAVTDSPFASVSDTAPVSTSTTAAPSLPPTSACAPAASTSTKVASPASAFATTSYAATSARVAHPAGTARFLRPLDRRPCVSSTRSTISDGRPALSTCIASPVPDGAIPTFERASRASSRSRVRRATTRTAASWW